MTKKILSIGFEFPGNAAEYIPFRFDQSLLDADIIVFAPDISSYIDYDCGKMEGKPALSESNSFRLVEDCSHWRNELKTAFGAGKTIIIFMSTLQNVFVHTGKKEFSGSGRNMRTTNLYDSYNNYRAVPLDLGKIIPKGGKEIKVIRDLGFLAPYWKEFAVYSEYEVYLEGDIQNPILTTKTGDKVVGAVYSGTKGTMVLIPQIRYDEESFTEFNEKEGKGYWTKEAVDFGNRLVSCLVGIDKVLSGSREATPPPGWSQQDEYRMKKEGILENKIGDITSELDKLQSSRSTLTLQLQQEGGLRRLLYEKGLQLEEAILEALKLMGFKATKYRDAESEFDSIFGSQEGRFLGEAEGKDNNAINIDKLSQLERNIQEDYTREDVSGYAKGVLFGNAYRLKPPSERPEFFTKKCLTGAQRSGLALVRTTDLFNVAKYLKEHNDKSYATKCREVLTQTKGEIVKFPQRPVTMKSKKKKDIAESSGNKKT